MTLVVLELKQAEVDFLAERWRCRTCDHLGAFHFSQMARDTLGHLEYEVEPCKIDGCLCEDFR